MKGLISVGQLVIAKKDFGEFAETGDTLVVHNIDSVCEFPILVINMSTPGAPFGVDFDEVTKKPL